jgi:hypothetical protein
MAIGPHVSSSRRLAYEVWTGWKVLTIAAVALTLIGTPLSFVVGDPDVAALIGFVLVAPPAAGVLLRSLRAGPVPWDVAPGWLHALPGKVLEGLVRPEYVWDALRAKIQARRNASPEERRRARVDAKIQAGALDLARTLASAESEAEAEAMISARALAEIFVLFITESVARAQTEAEAQANPTTQLTAQLAAKLRSDLRAGIKVTAWRVTMSRPNRKAELQADLKTKLAPYLLRIEIQYWEDGIPPKINISYKLGGTEGATPPTRHEPPTPE